MFTLFYKIVDLIAHKIELLNKAYGVKLSRITKKRQYSRTAMGKLALFSNTKSRK
jgi:hypothetical protein